jgi:outer membrane receptor protein involved in Fe transport
MSGLDGNYRGSGDKVNFNDINGRRNARKDLKEVFGWDLEENPTPKRIDLLHKNRKGGVDVEEGKWKGLYRDQSPVNFNKFTYPLQLPTANFPIRKEQYFNEQFKWETHNEQLIDSYNPDFIYNSLIRYNIDFTEFFFVDYEIYQKILKERGFWATSTVGKRGKNGEKLPELWMCWELKDVIFYKKENGIWAKDRTLEDSDVYDKLVEKYEISYQKNKDILDKIRNKRKY